MKLIKITMLAVLVFSLFSCQEKAFNPTPDQGPDFSLTPMENEEAEMAALHISGKLIAPVPLYNKIKNELDLIRSSWSDSIPYVNLKFSTYWEPSTLYLSITSKGYDSIVVGNYHYWDSLNSIYEIDSLRISYLVNGGNVTIKFKGRLNSILLGQAYSGLPEIRYLFTSATAGDWPQVWLHQEGETIKYFFRYAYGDCPAGCMYSDIYYFTVSADSAIFHGSFLLYGGYTETPPAWLDTALMARIEYYAFYQWRPN